MVYFEKNKQTKKTERTCNRMNHVNIMNVHNETKRQPKTFHFSWKILLVLEKKLVCLWFVKEKRTGGGRS